MGGRARDQPSALAPPPSGSPTLSDPLPPAPGRARHAAVGSWGGQALRSNLGDAQHPAQPPGAARMACTDIINRSDFLLKK